MDAGRLAAVSVINRTGPRVAMCFGSYQSNRISGTSGAPAFSGEQKTLTVTSDHIDIRPYVLLNTGKYWYLLAYFNKFMYVETSHKHLLMYLLFSQKVLSSMKKNLIQMTYVLT